VPPWHKGDAKLAAPLTVVGRARVSPHHSDEAIAPLERALALRTASAGARATDLAETRFGLARALWDAHRITPGPGRSRPERAYGAASSERAGIDAWLAHR
jgi:hypothetical protein